MANATSLWLAVYVRGDRHTLQLTPFVWGLSLGHCPCCNSVAQFGPLSVFVEPSPKNVAADGPAAGIGCHLGGRNSEISVFPLAKWKVAIENHWAFLGPFRFVTW